MNSQNTETQLQRELASTEIQGKEGIATNGERKSCRYDIVNGDKNLPTLGCTNRLGNGA